MGITLYAWQKKITDKIRDGKKKVIICCCRQIGKTTLLAMIALWALTFNKGNSGVGKNTKIGIVSRSDTQAKKMLADIKNLMRLGDYHIAETRDISEFFTKMIDSSQTAANNRTTITFLPREGSKIASFIKSFPPTDAILGNTLDFIFPDEASRIDERQPDIYDRAIVPTTIENPHALTVITSTPRGHFGFFYDLFDPYNNYKVHEYERFWFDMNCIQYDVPMKHASIKEKYDAVVKKGDEITARQEYFADFVVNETSFFNPLDIDTMIDEKASAVFDYSGSCDMGIDFGGKGTSHSVITISGLDEHDNIRRIYHRRYDISEDGSIIEDVEQLLKDFKVDNIICDDCPAAQYIMNKMEEKGMNLTKMNFAGEKTKKYGSFREQLHKQRIRTYMDEELVIEMRAMIQKQISGSRTKIAAPKGYTDDLIDSFMMSAYFYIDEVEPFRFLDIDDL